MEQNAPVTAYHPNWKRQFLISGAVVGALVGVATAFLLARAAEEDGDGPPEIKTVDIIRAAMSIIGAMRGVASLGKRL